MSMELLTRQLTDYYTDNTQAHAKTAEAVAGLGDRLRHVEQQMTRRADGGGIRSTGPDTLGRAVVESDNFKGYLESGSRGAVRIQHEEKAVTSAVGSAGAAIEADHRPDIVPMTRRRPTIRNLLAVARTASNTVAFARQTGRTLNAAPVAETTLKPESDLALTPKEAPVRTIAHYLPVSRQAMDDAPLLAAFIDTELRFGLAMTEEAEILHGDGTGQHLHGLIPQATAFAAPFSITGATAADVILLALAQAELSDLPATGIVLNTADWSKMMALKDSTGQYLGGGPWAVQEPRLWGLPVVATPSMNEGDFLVGNFQQAATLYDRMTTEVLISSEHADFWVRNMLAVRAESRLALAVKQPAALVFGSFAA